MARKIDELIWHCTATPEGREVSVAEVTAWHKKRKFKTIGYHKLVHLDGSFSVGRPENEIGAHVQGRNTGTLGYCYVGGMSAGMSGPKDTRTPAQKETMERLTREVVAKYGITRISGHNEYANKACPSFDVRNDPIGQLATDHKHDLANVGAAEASIPATKAPEAPKVVPRPSSAHDPLVEAVQMRLLELGYAEVGEIDGIFGTKTRGAILAFEADNELPLTGTASKELLVELLSAEPRQLARERTEAPAKEVRQKVPEVKANWLAKVWAQVSAVGALAYAAIAGMVENFEGAQLALDPVLQLAGDVPPWLFGLALAVGAFWLWHKARQGEQAGVAAYQLGERR